MKPVAILTTTLMTHKTALGRILSHKIDYNHRKVLKRIYLAYFVYQIYLHDVIDCGRTVTAMNRNRIPTNRKTVPSRQVTEDGRVLGIRNSKRADLLEHLCI